MQLIPLAVSSCNSAACPTVFVDEEARDDGADIVVQGYIVPASRSQSPPEGEALVRIPRHLLVQAARKLPGHG
jgi:hypothetical protein